MFHLVLSYCIRLFTQFYLLTKQLLWLVNCRTWWFFWGKTKLLIIHSLFAFELFCCSLKLLEFYWFWWIFFTVDSNGFVCIPIVFTIILCLFIVFVLYAHSKAITQGNTIYSLIILTRNSFNWLILYFDWYHNWHNYFRQVRVLWEFTLSYV